MKTREEHLKECMEHTTPESMRKTLDGLARVIDHVFAQINDWRDVYEFLALTGPAISKVSTPGDTDTKDLIHATFLGMYLKGYVSFRLSQPTMTDFEMSKALLHAHVIAELRESYAGYKDYKKEMQGEQRNTDHEEKA